jgi:hypothetical protein
MDTYMSSLVFAQQSLVKQALVVQGTRGANLKVRWREASVVGEQRFAGGPARLSWLFQRLSSGRVRSRTVEHIHGGLTEDGRILVLLVGQQHLYVWVRKVRGTIVKIVSNWENMSWDARSAGI